MKKIALVLIAALPLAGCATTAQTRAEQLAYCRNMEGEMGTDTRHDHAEAKGMPANRMNLTHEQCRQVLAKN